MKPQRYKHSSENPDSLQSTLKFLKVEQVSMIDEALSSLGEFGEVRLVVEKGHLRFVTVQKSIDALKWHPGSISEHSR